MENRFVIDTVAFINYYTDFFREKDELSKQARKSIDSCLDKYTNTHRLIIPSIVLIEVFRKFLKSPELVNKFYYEVFMPLKENECVEIKPIENEVLEVFKDLNDFKLENHDRLIFASAIQLNSVLITKDPMIIDYNKKRNLVPLIIY